jgi:hypothetical protein
MTHISGAVGDGVYALRTEAIRQTLMSRQCDTVCGGITKLPSSWALRGVSHLRVLESEGITGLPGRWESLIFESPSARGYNWATRVLGESHI